MVVAPMFHELRDPLSLMAITNKVLKKKDEALAIVFFFTLIGVLAAKDAAK